MLRRLGAVQLLGNAAVTTRGNQHKILLLLHEKQVTLCNLEIDVKYYLLSTSFCRSEQPLLELPFVNMTEAFQKSSNESLNESIEEEPTSAFSKFAYTMEDMDGFDELSTRVIVHGFGSACPHVWIYEMKTALMAVVSNTQIQ